MVVRVADLQAGGFARSTISHRCRAGGPWRWLLPGVVALHNGPPTRDDRRRAALLYCGACVLTGLDALQLHGMRRMPSPSGPVHVLVPADTRRLGAGRVLVERTHRLPPATYGRWPLAPICRAALDFARRSRDRTEVRSTLAEVVQRRRCTPAELNVELASGSGRGSALPREVLREISAGVRSVAEADARTLAQRSGLPTPQWNVPLHDGTGRLIAIPDAWFDEVAMAWEIDSLEWHLSPEDYGATLDRRAAMMAAGIVVVHHQPKKLHREPAQVLSDLRVNHAHAARRPRPPVWAFPSA
jgi:hypothetical protein